MKSTLHIYQHEIQAYLGSTPVLTFERKYRTKHNSVYVIKYNTNNDCDNDN